MFFNTASQKCGAHGPVQLKFSNASISTASAQESTRVLVAHTEGHAREGLFAMLQASPGLEVVGVAANATSAFRLLAGTRPDIVLIESGMVRDDDIGRFSESGKAKSGVRLVLITPKPDTTDVAQEITCGLGGELNADFLCEAIHSILNGQYAIGRSSVLGLAAGLKACESGCVAQREPERSGLTRRELEIVEEILAGCSNLRIAKKLSISVNTVKRHLGNIFAKLAVSNRLELALLTIKPGRLGRAVRLSPSKTGTRRLPKEHRSNRAPDRVSSDGADAPCAARAASWRPSNLGQTGRGSRIQNVAIDTARSSARSGSEW